MSLHLDILNTFSVHPASPVLLTSKGPQKTQAIRPHTPRGRLKERRAWTRDKDTRAERARVGPFSTARPQASSTRNCFQLRCRQYCPTTFAVWR